MFQCGTSATGGQYDCVIVDTDILRVDNLIAFTVFQYTVLVDTGRMGESITSDNRLVRLNRHVHQAGNRTADAIDFGCVYIGFDTTFFVATEDHGYFFQRSITGTFADTVDGHFHLAGTVQDTLHGIGCCHTQVIMAVGGDDCMLDTIHMFHQIFDLFTIFVGQTVTGRIRDIHNGCTRFDHRLHDTCQIGIVRTSGIFAVEFDIFHISFGIFGGSDGTLQYLVLVGVELITDMVIGSTDTGMDTSAFGELQCFGSHIYIFFNRTGQSTDSRPGNGLGYFNHTVEIARTRYRKSCLNHIDAQFFECSGNLNLFNTV